MSIPTEAPEGAEVARAGGGPGWSGFLIPLIFAALAAFAVGMIVGKGAGGTIEVGTGGVKIKLEKDDRLEVVVKRALDEQPTLFRALMSNLDIYAIDDAALVARLRDKPLPPEVRDGIRDMLFKLEGPFALPGTLAGAGGDFYRAVADLADELQKLPAEPSAAIANAFYAALYTHQLDQTGIFVPRAFAASVRRVEAPQVVREGRHTAYVCSGSDLVGRNISLFVDTPEGARGITVVADLDLSRFNCSEPQQTLASFLARHPARIGLPRQTLAQLLGPVDVETPLPDEMSAQFQVAPRHYLPEATLAEDVARGG